MRACNMLQVVVLMCACAVTLAIVCESDSCAKVECDVGVSKESCVDGEFNERGSFCGCCATCDKHLEEVSCSWSYGYKVYCLVSEEGESCLLLELDIQEEGESCLLQELGIQEEGESCLLQEIGIQGFPLVPCKSPLSCLNGVCSLPESTSANNETHT
uniref:TNFR-Cys domain-containing protein n=1 Tax=Timema genevievae TaxID=629358 RepID=A0A7R9PLM9_TIMGE|nr:unnamed protein product [Timema genevievae]